MGLKIVCVLMSAVMIKTIAGQIIRAPYPAPYPNEIAAANFVADSLAHPAYNPVPGALPCEAAAGPGVPGLTVGLSLAELSASNGPGLRINSVSPIASTGVTVETDKMAIEGPLAVTGQLPFLGVVALDGPLPASGTGAVAYECGNGNVGITSEGVEPAPVLAPVYPNMPQAYPNAPHPQAYPNMQFAPGYPNAGYGPYPSAPGYGPVPQA